MEDFFCVFPYQTLEFVEVKTICLFPQKSFNVHRVKILQLVMSRLLPLLPIVLCNLKCVRNSFSISTFDCREVMKVKQDNKNRLTGILVEATGIKINPNSIFDIQVRKFGLSQRTGTKKSDIR